MANLSGKTTYAAILGIVFAAYAVVLVLAAPKDAALWCVLAFGAAQLAILLVLGLSKTAGVGAEGLFKTYPKLVLPFGCFAAQLIAGAILAFALPGNVIVPAIAGIVLLAVSALSLLGMEKAVAHIDQVEECVANDSDFMRGFLLDLQDLRAGDALDEGAVQALENLIDKVRFSDVRSTESVYSIETEITARLLALSEAQSISKADIEGLVKLIDSRNRRLKASK